MGFQIRLKNSSSPSTECQVAGAGIPHWRAFGVKLEQRRRNLVTGFDFPVWEPFGKH